MDHPTTKCYWGACMNVPESSKHACEYHRQSEAAYRCEKRAQNHEKRDSILNTPPRSIGRKNFATKKLLADEKTIPHTLTYLNRIGRFKHIYGDIAPD